MSVGGPNFRSKNIYTINVSLEVVCCLLINTCQLFLNSSSKVVLTE